MSAVATFVKKLLLDLEDTKKIPFVSEKKVYFQLARFRQKVLGQVPSVFVPLLNRFGTGLC